MNAHPFEGMVLIPTQQLADIVKVMVVAGIKEELDRREAAQPATDALPNEVPAAQAASYCGWKTAKSIAKFHGAGLTPIYLGKKLFYKKKEVEALRKKRQNL